MGWKFVDSYGKCLVSISNDATVELAHCIIDAVAKAYSSEAIL